MDEMELFITVFNRKHITYTIFENFFSWMGKSKNSEFQESQKNNHVQRTYSASELVGNTSLSNYHLIRSLDHKPTISYLRKVRKNIKLPTIIKKMQYKIIMVFNEMF
uniref:Uncharacterized protein n=1 Tax=Megaselia scalaris TaxID=36166 RepID=T1GW29_MEGSC